MKSKPERHNTGPSWGIIALAAAAVLAAGGGTAWWAYRHLAPAPEVSQPARQPLERGKAQVYWLEGETLKLLPAPAGWKGGGKEREAVETALQELLAGPQAANQITAIPPGTKLLGLIADGGGIRVNLSREFTEGGGSASMIGRLGQILYTATSLQPESAVWLEVEGQPLQVLGGEGLEVEQPLTRRQFKESFP